MAITTGRMRFSGYLIVNYGKNARYILLNSNFRLLCDLVCHKKLLYTRFWLIWCVYAALRLGFHLLLSSCDTPKYPEIPDPSYSLVL